jgi:hypothetical protein
MRTVPGALVVDLSLIASVSERGSNGDLLQEQFLIDLARDVAG